MVQQTRILSRVPWWVRIGSASLIGALGIVAIIIVLGRPGRDFSSLAALGILALSIAVPLGVIKRGVLAFTALACLAAVLLGWALAAPSVPEFALIAIAFCGILLAGTR